MPNPAALETAHGHHGALTDTARNAVIGLIAFLTVVDLFAAQAILPLLAAAYGVGPAAMGLSVNASTFGMALAGLGVAVLGARVDRRTAIVTSLVLLAVPTSLLAFAPNLPVFAGLRVAQGLCMASAFTLTLTYLGERCTAQASAGAFAAYITGNVASNLFGRMIAAGVADHAGLGATFLTLAGLNLAGAALVAITLTQPRMRGMGPPEGRSPLAAWALHLSNPRLRASFLIGFCILFAFIGPFTYVPFVLARESMALAPMMLGLVYLVFLPSIATTPLAGRTVARFGTRRSLRIALALAAAGLPLLWSLWLPAMLVGLTILAVGTFFAQAVVTGYVGRTATFDRQAASGLYLASYFCGGLAGSFLVGQAFEMVGWGAALVEISLALVAAGLFAAQLTDG